MRVVAGSLRGRPIVAPEGAATRPTTDRVREATFNSLESHGAIDDMVVADLFAGSGALGIEALSRGARSCTFVERDRDALRAIRANVDKLGIGDRSTIVASDVFAGVATLRSVDLVLADPPYGFDAWERLLGALEPILAPDAVVVLESDRPIEVPTGWEEFRSKRYSRTWVAFLRRTEAA
jgi:16S rRNA (guanine966-N2)-methyltransferase